MSNKFNFNFCAPLFPKINSFAIHGFQLRLFSWGFREGKRISPGNWRLFG